MEYAFIIFVVASLAVAAMTFGLWLSNRQSANQAKSEPMPDQAQPNLLPSVSSDPSQLFDIYQDEEAEDGQIDVDITMVGEIPSDVLDELERQLEATKTDETGEEIAVDVNLDGMDAEFFGDEPTHPHAMILSTGIARTDRGRKRPCNEDAYLIMEDVPLYVVADGMGGHAAGDVASQLAVETIEKAFLAKTFNGPSHKGWPKRGDELARTLHMANQAVSERSQSDTSLAGMGTTVVAARFARNKQRVYIANVGDSRCYKIRDGELQQLTQDHTLGAVLGITGRRAKHLTQSVGIRPWVSVDLFIDQPLPGDRYLVCSDGLTKMMSDDDILATAESTDDLEASCQALVDHANACGGRDNITVIAIRVDNPRDIAVAAGKRS